MSQHGDRVDGQAARPHESGATSVEYGLVVLAIFTVLVTTVFLFGKYAEWAFTFTNTKLAPYL